MSAALRGGARIVGALLAGVGGRSSLPAPPVRETLIERKRPVPERR
jgi:hypothetical protein